jgi:hypothetical protein
VPLGKLISMWMGGLCVAMSQHNSKDFSTKGAICLRIPSSSDFCFRNFWK